MHQVSGPPRSSRLNRIPLVQGPRSLRAPPSADTWAASSLCLLGRTLPCPQRANPRPSPCVQPWDPCGGVGPRSAVAPRRASRRTRAVAAPSHGPLSGAQGARSSSWSSRHLGLSILGSSRPAHTGPEPGVGTLVPSRARDPLHPTARSPPPRRPHHGWPCSQTSPPPPGRAARRPGATSVLSRHSFAAVPAGASPAVCCPRRGPETPAWPVAEEAAGGRGGRGPLSPHRTGLGTRLCLRAPQGWGTGGQAVGGSWLWGLVHGSQWPSPQAQNVTGRVDSAVARVLSPRGGDTQVEVQGPPHPAEPVNGQRATPGC